MKTLDRLFTESRKHRARVVSKMPARTNSVQRRQKRADASAKTIYQSSDNKADRTIIARRSKTTLTPMYPRLHANENYPGYKRPELAIHQTSRRKLIIMRLITIGCRQQFHSIYRNAVIKRRDLMSLCSYPIV